MLLIQFNYKKRTRQTFLSAKGRPEHCICCKDHRRKTCALFSLGSGQLSVSLYKAASELYVCVFVFV